MKDIAQSAILAWSASVFYRKGFNSKKLPCILGGILLASLWDLQFHWAVKPMICMFSLLAALIKREHVDPQSWAVFYFSLIVGVRSQWLTLACASVQLIRKPLVSLDMMSKLRKPRSLAGPVYVYMVADDALFASHSLPYPALIAAASALLAGIFFRPDNGVMLELCNCKSTPESRRNVHKWLMFASLVLYIGSQTANEWLIISS